MKPFLIVLFIAIECNCQDDPQLYSLPSRYVYEDADEDINAKQYFKASRRSDEEVAPQEEDNYPNYPKGFRLEALSEDSNYNSRRASKARGAKKAQPVVEQYLKEVTPTTKIRYDQKQKEVSQRAIARSSTSPIRYIHVPQQDLQQKSAVNIAQSYEIPDAVNGPYKNSQEALQKNLLAFRDVVLAHQNALAAQQKLAQSQTQSESKKKPPRKNPKPKQHPDEDDVDFYARVQQYQQQNEPRVYEKEEPAPARYQAKLQSYQNEFVSEQRLAQQQAQQLAQHQAQHQAQQLAQHPAQQSAQQLAQERAQQQQAQQLAQQQAQQRAQQQQAQQLAEQQAQQLQQQLAVYQQIAARQGARQRPRTSPLSPSVPIHQQQQDETPSYQDQPLIKYQRITPADAVVPQQHNQNPTVEAARIRQLVVTEDDQQKQVEDVQYQQQEARIGRYRPQAAADGEENEQQRVVLSDAEAIQKYKEIIERYQQAEALKAVQANLRQGGAEAGQQGDRYVVYTSRSQEPRYVDSGPEQPENLKAIPAPPRSRIAQQQLRHRQPSNIRYLKTPIRHLVYSSE